MVMRINEEDTFDTEELSPYEFGPVVFEDWIDTSDYSGEELPPSEDFAPEMKDSKPVMTNEVASDLAGQAALLAGGSDPASSYDVVKEELCTSEVAKIPIIKPVNGFEVAVSKYSAVSLPSSLNAPPIKPIAVKKIYKSVRKINILAQVGIDELFSCPIFSLLQ